MSLNLPSRARVIVGLIVDLILIAPTFALFARRLHDQNKTSWWVLLVPIQLVLAIAAGVSLESAQRLGAYRSVVADTLGWLALVVAIAVLVLYFLPGTSGRNRYGDDPREIGTATT